MTQRRFAADPTTRQGIWLRVGFFGVQMGSNQRGPFFDTCSEAAYSSLGKRFDEQWSLGARVADGAADRVRRDAFGGVLAGQSANEVRVGDGGVEPGGVGLWAQNDGHAVVDGGEFGVGCGREEGEAEGVVVALKQAGEGEQGVVGRVDEEGLLFAACGVPLVVAGRRHDDAAFPPGAAEHGFLRDGFDASIDGGGRLVRIADPAGQQAPACVLDASRTIDVGPDDGCALAWSDVVAGERVGDVGREVVDVVWDDELLMQSAGGAVECIASAHGCLGR